MMKSGLMAIALTCAALILLSPGVSSATETEKGQASFETCGQIAAEQLTTIQLYQQGLSLELLKETLPGLSSEGEARIERFYQAIEADGLLTAYSATNARYARCARQVHDNRGKPSPRTREHHFYVCAGENKVRYEILLAALAGGEPDEVLPQLHASHRPVAEALYESLHNHGPEHTFNDLATELKRCLSRAG